MLYHKIVYGNKKKRADEEIAEDDVPEKKPCKRDYTTIPIDGFVCPKDPCK